MKLKKKKKHTFKVSHLFRPKNLEDFFAQIPKQDNWVANYSNPGALSHDNYEQLMNTP